MIEVTIERQNGTIISTDDIDFFVDDFRVSPPTMNHIFETVEGRHGNVDFGSTLEPRQITLTGYFKSYDKESFPIYRDRLAQTFVSTEPFYLTDSRQPYKRWLAKLDGEWKADRIPFHNVGEVEITFTTVGLPLATSKYTSLKTRQWEDDAYYWGSGLEWSDETFVYTENGFIVKNFGDVVVDPRQMELVIHYAGESNRLRIQNVTTGDDWRYDGATITGDNLLINGIRSLKNGTSIIRQTNKQLITLAPGDNHILVSGTKGDFVISFEFRFLYL